DHVARPERQPGRVDAVGEPPPRVDGILAGRQPEPGLAVTAVDDPGADRQVAVRSGADRHQGTLAVQHGDAARQRCRLGPPGVVYADLYGGLREHLAHRAVVERDLADADVIRGLAGRFDGQGVLPGRQPPGRDGEVDHLVILIGRQPAEFLAVE